MFHQLISLKEEELRDDLQAKVTRKSKNVFHFMKPNLKFNFPNHKYLGPGNDIENGEPVDEDDEIAKEHDLAYEYSKSHKDIRKADRNAIKKIGRSIGALGLGIKYGVESLIGVQYPRMAPTNWPNDDDLWLHKVSEGLKDYLMSILIETTRIDHKNPTRLLSFATDKNNKPALQYYRVDYTTAIDSGEAKCIEH